MSMIAMSCYLNVDSFLLFHSGSQVVDHHNLSVARLPHLCLQIKKGENRTSNYCFSVFHMNSAALLHSASLFAFVIFASGLDGAFKGCSRVRGVSLKLQGLRMIGKIVTFSCFAAISSGGTSCFIINSEARKSVLTNNTAIFVHCKACSISASHSVPGAILVSSISLHVC